MWGKKLVMIRLDDDQYFQFQVLLKVRELELLEVLQLLELSALLVVVLMF